MAIALLPPRVPLVNPTSGVMSKEWYLFFQQIYERVGGADGASNTDLDLSQFNDAGIEEARLDIISLRDQIESVPLLDIPLPPDEPCSPAANAVLDDLVNRISYLETQLFQTRSELAEVQKELESLGVRPWP